MIGWHGVVRHWAAGDGGLQATGPPSLQLIDVEAISNLSIGFPLSSELEA